MERFVSFFGLFVLMFLAWLMSPHKRIIPWRVIFGGLALQFLFAYWTLRTIWGRAVFDAAGHAFNDLLGCVAAGSRFVFGDQYGHHFFAFGVLPTIIFFAALMSVLYYCGVMQWVVRGFSIVMQKTLGTSGAETLSTSANIFVGQTEAPLVIKPYVGDMTESELMAVMVGGFGTTAGGVLALCVSMGIDAGHLMAASVIAAPATLIIAKLMQPEIGKPRTMGVEVAPPKSPADNLIHAATIGSNEGLMLALNVAAVLIAFLALVAMFNGILGWFGGKVGAWMGSAVTDPSPSHVVQASLATWLAKSWSLENIFGLSFAPIAWVIGIEWRDCFRIGELLGMRMVANEVVAYQQLAHWMEPNSPVQLSQRSVILATYALSGFANFSSIGIQVGGIGPMAPHRQGDLARLGLRAMLGGTLVCLMTACVAGVLLSDKEIADRHERTRQRMAKVVPPDAPVTLARAPAKPSSRGV